MGSILLSWFVSMKIIPDVVTDIGEIGQLSLRLPRYRWSNCQLKHRKIDQKTLNKRQPCFTWNNVHYNHIYQSFPKLYPFWSTEWPHVCQNVISCILPIRVMTKSQLSHICIHSDETLANSRAIKRSSCHGCFITCFRLQTSPDISVFETLTADSTPIRHCLFNYLHTYGSNSLTCC